MKILLPAIQNALKTLTLLPAQTACYITADARWRPDGVDTTCLGIMSGGVTREELGGEVWEITATVELVGFVPLTADAKDSICGTAGVEQLLDDAVTVLKNNQLGLGEVQRVRIGDDRPNGMHQVVDGTLLVSVIRQVIYTIERASV
jgi:hypothetical protein